MSVRRAGGAVPSAATIPAAVRRVRSSPQPRRLPLLALVFLNVVEAQTSPDLVSRMDTKHRIPSLFCFELDSAVAAETGQT